MKKLILSLALVVMFLVVTSGIVWQHNRTLNEENLLLKKELNQSYLDWLGMKGERDSCYALVLEGNKKPSLSSLRAECINQAESEYNRNTESAINQANSGELDGYETSAILAEIKKERTRKQELCASKY